LYDIGDPRRCQNDFKRDERDKKVLTDALKRQFNNAFDVLEAAIRSFGPDQWRCGSSPYNGPGRAAVHVLQCAEFYTCGDSKVQARFGKPVWQMSDGEVPLKEQVLPYLTKARQETLAWIDSIGDAGLAAPWPADSSVDGLDRVAYALRHLQHHTGEICAYQKQAGLEPAPWK